jgi:hypothetical protein
MNLDRWFRPTWLAWAAPRTGGKGVLLKDPCSFDPSRCRGNFYPEGDGSQYDLPLSADCPASSPAAQGLARLQARDNSNIFAHSATDDVFRRLGLWLYAAAANPILPGTRYPICGEPVAAPLR